MVEMCWLRKVCDAMTWIRSYKKYGGNSQWHIKRDGLATIDGHTLNYCNEIQTSFTLPQKGAICGKCLRVWSENAGSK